MSPPVMCGCALCTLEPRLLSALSFTEADAIHELFSRSERLRQFSSVRAMLSQFEIVNHNTGADNFLFDCSRRVHTIPLLSKALLVLAFLPMLHVTVRRVGKQQSNLAPEDIAQQALSVLLQHLRSDELQARQSHFAFAISRAVKRKVFEWARRESTDCAVQLPMRTGARYTTRRARIRSNDISCFGTFSIAALRNGSLRIPN